LSFSGIHWIGCGHFRSTRAVIPDINLDRVQRGLDPDDWKPMTTVGPGVREIRVQDASGAYRIVFVASLAEAVYVLHAFQKKTQRTAARDLVLARSRYRELKQGGSR
jgi:phage-related protein